MISLIAHEKCLKRTGASRRGYHDCEYECDGDADVDDDNDHVRIRRRNRRRRKIARKTMEIAIMTMVRMIG